MYWPRLQAGDHHVAAIGYSSPQSRASLNPELYERHDRQSPDSNHVSGRPSGTGGRQQSPWPPAAVAGAIIMSCPLLPTARQSGREQQQQRPASPRLLLYLLPAVLLLLAAAAAALWQPSEAQQHRAGHYSQSQAGRSTWCVLQKLVLYS